MPEAQSPEAPGERELAGRLARVREEIRTACGSVGRTTEPELIVVTKFQPAAMVRELHALGERDFGESRHPEARDKRAEAGSLPDARWHFIGQIQTKKARPIIRYADVIHSIDRPALVEALASAEVPSPIEALVQVSLTEEPGRGGCRPDDLPALADLVEAAPALRLRGVMAVAPLGGDPRRAFERVALLSERLAVDHPGATWRSIGMSGDFREAIEFGATHLRIGAAITGKRPVRA